jgi:Tol biopolymer transport system component
MKSLITPWLLGCLATAFLLFVGTGCFPASSPQQLVFVSTADGDPEVVLLDVETGESVTLTGNGSADMEPQLSPDGKLVVFQSDESGNMDINLADLQNETIVRLTSEVSDDTSPKWSPNGKQIAFVSDRDGNNEVYSMDVDGTNLTRVTSNKNEDELGDWSPDSAWLVFSSAGNEAEQGLWLRNPNGINLVRLTSDQDRDPAWSRDGNHIAFVRGEGDDQDVYIVSKSKDGTWHGELQVTQVTRNDVVDKDPAWAPNGKSIVLVSARDGNSEIYAIQFKGSGLRRLTNNAAEDLMPAWDPSGERIAFVSRLYGEGEIIVMNADGAGQRRLTNNDAEDWSPRW